MKRFICSFTMLERGLLAAGVILLGVIAAALLDRWLASRRALRDFDDALAAAQTAPAPVPLDFGSQEDVSFSLWSNQRKRAYQTSLLNFTSMPLAVLRVRKLDLRVPVFEGTGELVLNRGAGWIAGTARPGQMGNIGIAGHRDGFFRALKDAAPGDAIELATIHGTSVYTVDEIEIVSPQDVGVLGPRGTPALTLVTCYPFYFIGDAPQRYILHAALTGPAANQLEK